MVGRVKNSPFHSLHRSQSRNPRSTLAPDVMAAACMPMRQIRDFKAYALQEEDGDGNRQGLTIAEYGESGGPGQYAAFLQVQYIHAGSRGWWRPYGPLQPVSATTFYPLSSALRFVWLMQQE